MSSVTESKNTALLKVKSDKSARELAVAIVATCKNHNYAVLRSLGAKCVYTSMKSLAFARETLAIADWVPVAYFSKFSVVENGQDIKGIQIRIENNQVATGKIGPEDDPALLKVGTNTQIDGLHLAILSTFRKHKYSTIRFLGAKAADTAAKAIIKARGELAIYDIDLIGYISIFEAKVEDGDTQPGVQIRLVNSLDK